jgi:glycosyltransferase involved in cell wall biosynthesis
VSLDTTGIRVTPEQRAHGDNRRLGVYVKRITWKGRGGEGEVDLEGPTALPDRPVTLSRDRFVLPLNRSVVRLADAFVVHSDYVRGRILEERNSPTPIGVLHHGAEYRMRVEDRGDTRRRMGLSQEWVDSFVVTSFGGVQPHKRIDKALAALAQARRERDDIRLILAGSLTGEFDPKAMVRHLGLEDAVHFTGFVPEEEAWDWLHAGDVALNLRGPSTGGTSGGLFQAFSVGRPVIASDAAEQKELPDSCVMKIPLGADEVPSLARTFVSLRDDPARRRELEAEVLRFVETECHWGIVARRYAEAMQKFPRARASRRGLIAMKLASRRDR